jgi:hypothetical protein
MNERIKELAEQAKKYALDDMVKIADKEQALKAYSDSHDTKFAELIVRECTNIVADAVDHREPASTYVDKIKQHFGFEVSPKNIRVIKI